MAAFAVCGALVPVAAAAQAQPWTPLPQPLTVAVPSGDETITITVTGIRAIYPDESEDVSVRRFWVLPGPPGAAMTVTASWAPKDGGECENGSYYIQALDVGAWPQGQQRTQVVGCTSGPLTVSHSFTNLNRPFTVGLLRLNKELANPPAFYVAFGTLGADLTTPGRAEDHPFAAVDEEELSCSAVGMPGYSVHLGSLGLTVSDTELAYGSLGPRVRTTRTYNAMPIENQPVGTFGAGWTLDYESSLTVVPDGAMLRRGSGAVDPFGSTGFATAGVMPAADVRLTAPESKRERLTWRAGQGDFLLEDLDTHELRRYARASDRADLYRLVSVLDTNGNAVQVSYENATAAARVVSVTDAAGRVTTFEYPPGSGQPASAMVAPDGRRATFTYADVCSTATGVSVCAPMLATTTDFLGTVTNFTYDARGYLTRIESGGKTVSMTWASPATPAGLQHVASIVDASGGTTRYAFTGGGATEVTRPSGDVEAYLHNGNLLTQSIDAWGRRIVREYQADGLPSRIDDAGAVTTLAYDGDRNLVTQTDPVGRVTRWNWDADAYPTSLTTPDGAVRSYAYDARHNLTSVTSPLTLQHRLEYDARGLPTAVIDPMGRRRSMAYDAFGNLESFADRTLRTTTFTYDSMGRVTSVRPAGEAPGIRFAYDANDRLVSQTAADGGQRRITYDACTPTAVTDELGARTLTAWDGGLRLREVTDAVGQTWRRTYDADGLPLSDIDPLGRTTSLAYGKTAGSGSVRVTDPTQAVWWLYLNQRQSLLAVEGPERDGTRPRTRFTRNAADEIVGVEDPLGNVVSHTRDALGRVARTTNARGGRVEDTFDTEGRWTSRTHDSTPAAALVYDASGALVSSQAFAVGTTTYVRDAEGRVLAITYPDGTTTRTTFDARGNRSTLTYPSGLGVTYVYDAMDRVSRVTWAGASVDVQRDAAGRVVGLARSNGVGSSLTLDALGRVARVVHGSPGRAVVDLTIARDGAGNVVRVRGVEPHARGFTAETTQVTYDSADQIVARNGATYRYDSDGNLEQVSGAASWTAGYDLENRLVSVSRTGRPSLSFTYDAFGRRARSASGGSYVEFLRADDGALLAELDDTNTVVAEYIHVDGRLLAMRRGGATYFYLFDHLGSTLALTDGAGAMVASYGYDVTGRVIARSGSLTNRFTFVGEHGVEDDGVGLYLMGRRHYDAVTGRFLQRDPIGLAGGPNLYAYAEGRPTTMVDPKGTDPFFVGAVVAAMAMGYIQYQYRQPWVPPPVRTESQGLACALYDWWTGEEARISAQVREQEERVAWARTLKWLEEEERYHFSDKGNGAAELLFALAVSDYASDTPER